MKAGAFTPAIPVGQAVVVRQAQLRSMKAGAFTPAIHADMAEQAHIVHDAQ